MAHVKFTRTNRTSATGKPIFVVEFERSPWVVDLLRPPAGISRNPARAFAGSSRGAGTISVRESEREKETGNGVVFYGSVI